MTDPQTPIDAAGVTFAAAAGKVDALYIYADIGDDEIDLERGDERPIVLRNGDAMCVRFEHDRPQKISEALVTCRCNRYQVRLYDGMGADICPECGWMLEIRAGMILISQPV